MQRKLWLATAALVLALPVGLALAQPGVDTPNRRGGRGVQERDRNGDRSMRMFDRLDLSDRQKEQIKKIRDSGQAARLEARKDLLRLQNRLHGEMLEDTPNKSQILSLADQIDEVHSKLHKQHLEQWLDIRAVLTAEQRDKLMLMQGPMGPHGRHGRMGPQGQRGGFGRMGHGPMGFEGMMDLPEDEPGADGSS